MCQMNVVYIVVYISFIYSYIVADETLFLHSALSVLQTVHPLHTMCCVTYKCEAWA